MNTNQHRDMFILTTAPIENTRDNGYKLGKLHNRAIDAGLSAELFATNDEASHVKVRIAGTGSVELDAALSIAELCGLELREV